MIDLNHWTKIVNNDHLHHVCWTKHLINTDKNHIVDQIHNTQYYYNNPNRYTVWNDAIQTTRHQCLQFNSLEHQSILVCRGTSRHIDMIMSNVILDLWKFQIYEKIHQFGSYWPQLADICTAAFYTLLTLNRISTGK